MHLFTSTATFVLLSPLQHSTLYITYVNATAFYNHTTPVGVITYDLPFAVPPGATQTPNMPVDWTSEGVGYDVIKKALGGSLKLDASAHVGVKIDHFAETIWFVGGGIGAKVRI
ncbi:MAG: hypothetical protein M4579_005949 [Chaenotheca gracillima]|nr:MAG: hypothetical protein M4579_005949 [Chaenotheca gracillima]